MPSQVPPRPSTSRNPGSAGDAAKDASDWIDTILGEGGVGNSATRQMIFGGVSGWVTGFLAMKVGKAVAVALGGGIILLQVANHKGYININWSRFQNDVDNITNKMIESDKKKNWTDKIIQLASQNSYATVGFSGGFLIGLASS